MKSETVKAKDGTAIPLTWFDAENPRCVFVFLPALGIQAKWYKRLGIELAGKGCSVCLVEQRGHGASNVPIRRGTRFGIAEFVDQDIPVILDAVELRNPEAPVVLAGHSLGGHLATIYAGIKPKRISGVAHIACGFPYHRDFPASRARLIKLLCFLIPIAGVVPGYFPGKLIGFGGKESIRLMRDWRAWALTGRFNFDGREGIEQAVSRFTGPVISIELDKDDFSSPAAGARALSPFTRANVTRVTLGAAEQGDFLGHFVWARQPAGVVTCLSQWVAQEVNRPPEVIQPEG